MMKVVVALLLAAILFAILAAVFLNDTVLGKSNQPLFIVCSALTVIFITLAAMAEDVWPW